MFGRKPFDFNKALCGPAALLMAATTSLGGFLFGYNVGEISGILTFEEFIGRFGADKDQLPPFTLSLIVSLTSLGSLFGALSCAYTADWWGRRMSLLLGVFVLAVGDTCQMCASHESHLMLGRFVSGLGLGKLSVVAPMVQSESSPKETRGAVVASYQLLVTFGFLISTAICYGFSNIDDQPVSWRAVILLKFPFCLAFFAGVLSIPESPRWLASREDWEGARMSLAHLRGLADKPHDPVVEQDFDEMKEILGSQRQVGNSSWFECFRSSQNMPKVLYRTLLGVGIHFLQQWTGINYFFYYGVTIFESAGYEEPILIQLVLATVNVLATFFGLWLVERFGRRWPLIVGSLWQAGCLIVFASVGTARNSELQSHDGLKWSSLVMMASVFSFISSFACTWGPITWVAARELFPLRTRAKQASMATAGNWFGNFLIGFLSPIATINLSYSFGFVLVGTNLAAAALIFFCLYESQALSLENVNLMYGASGLKAWNSRKWVPPGYTTRYE